MKVIDLSHKINSIMPHFPGTHITELIRENTFEKDGFRVSRIIISSHAGTHLDSPSHMVRDGSYLNDFPADKFVGKGLCLDFNNLQDSIINLQNVLPFEKQIREVDFLLLNSGQSKLWGNDSYLNQYPVLSEQAAQWLGRFTLKGIGIDMISFDQVDSRDCRVHKILLAQNLVLIENLTQLEALVGKDFVFICLPLNLEKGDGSPVRAAALLELDHV